MKNIGLFIILTFVPAIGRAQVLFPVTENTTKAYKISGQDSIVDNWGEKIRINADLTITNWGKDPDGMYSIKFAKGKIKGDTIIIVIHDTNTIYDYKYDLKILRDKFSVNFWYQTTMDTAVRKIETIESKLMLKTKAYKKGAILTGYTEYKGRCVTLFDKNEIYIVRGTFKVRLE